MLRRQRRHPSGKATRQTLREISSKSFIFLSLHGKLNMKRAVQQCYARSYSVAPSASGKYNNRQCGYCFCSRSSCDVIRPLTRRRLWRNISVPGDRQDGSGLKSNEVAFISSGYKRMVGRYQTNLTHEGRLLSGIYFRRYLCPSVSPLLTNHPSRRGRDVSSSHCLAQVRKPIVSDLPFHQRICSSCARSKIFRRNPSVG